MTQLLSTKHLPGYGYGIEGLGAFWEYNGLILNDRRYPDKYRLISIAGLDDADIRGVSVNNPSAWGETPLNTLYGGRTIVLEGVIEAGNLFKLRDMQDDLRRAFSELHEAPLYIRTDRPGYQERFFRSQSKNDFQFSQGGSIVTMGGGEVVRSTNAVVSGIVTAADRRYVDVDTYACFLTGSNSSSSRYGVIVRAINQSNYIVGYVDGANGDLIIAKCVNDVLTTLSNNSSGLIIPSNGLLWVRLRAEGNNITIEFPATPWIGAAKEPEDFLGVFGTHGTHTLTGGDATTFGSGVRGYAGLYWRSSSVAEKLYLLRTRPRPSGDRVIFCRKSAPIVMDEKQEDFTFTRKFLVTLRSALPTIQAAKMSEHSQIFPPSPYTFTIENAGTVAALPLIRLHFPQNDSRITNLNTGEVFSLTGALTNPGYWEINSANRTIFEYSRSPSIVYNKYGIIDEGSIWPVIFPGKSTWRLETGQNDVSFEFVWRDSWI